MEFRSVKLHKAFEDELLFLMRDILHSILIFNIFLPSAITVDLALCLLLGTQIQFKPNIISSICSHWILPAAGLQINPKINAKRAQPAVAEDRPVVQHYFLHGAKRTSSFAFRCRLVHLQHVCSVNITVSWTINSK